MSPWQNRLLPALAGLLLVAIAGAGCLAPEDDPDPGTPMPGADAEAEAEAPREPNPEQAGMNGPCLDYNLFYDLPVSSPLDPRVAVEPGTGFTAASPDGPVQVDFFEAGDVWLGYATDGGVVPEGAEYGVVCVSLIDAWPGPPVPLAAWTYQDGL